MTTCTAFCSLFKQISLDQKHIQFIPTVRLNTQTNEVSDSMAKNYSAIFLTAQSLHVEREFVFFLNTQLAHKTRP